MNRDIIPKINKKYEKYDFKNGFNTKKRKQYIDELDSAWKNAYLSAMKSNNPELFRMGEEAVKRYLPFYEMYADYLSDSL